MLAGIKKFFIKLWTTIWSTFEEPKDYETTVDEVTNYIFELYPDEPMYWQILQKKLYVIYRDWLQTTGYHLFDDCFMAKEYGPELLETWWKYGVHLKQGMHCKPYPNSYWLEHSSRKVPKSPKVRDFIKRKLVEYKDYELLNAHAKGYAWFHGLEFDDSFIFDYYIARDSPLELD